MKRIALAVALAAAPGAVAAVKTEEVSYASGETKLKGLLAWDDAVKGKRPAVLVVHEWWGLNDYAKGRARQLAELGYVALAVDMYGDGQTAAHPEEAGAMASKVMADIPAARARFVAAKKVLESDPRVDASRIAAIGYCFGGATVLEMARAGTDLRAVVSFHGSLRPLTADPPAIKARVLVCHGADDPLIPAADVQALQDEMRKAGADWQLIVYGGARHSFTSPAADGRGMEALRYSASADRRSWAAMRAFLEEVLSP